MLDNSLRRCPFCGGEVGLVEAADHSHWTIVHVEMYPSCPIHLISIPDTDRYRLASNWSKRADV